MPHTSPESWLSPDDPIVAKSHDNLASVRIGDFGIGQVGLVLSHSNGLGHNADFLDRLAAELIGLAVQLRDLETTSEATA